MPRCLLLFATYYFMWVLCRCLDVCCFCYLLFYVALCRCLDVSILPYFSGEMGYRGLGYWYEYWVLYMGAIYGYYISCRCLLVDGVATSCSVDFGS